MIRWRLPTMILEYTLKGETIPHLYHFSIFFENQGRLWFTFNGETKMVQLDKIKDFVIHDDSYNKVIYTSLSLGVGK